MVEPGSATAYTVGHGRRSLAELIGVVSAPGIEKIVDVRRFPASRRHPHFGRDELATTLPGHEIAYEWWGDALGGRRAPAAHSRHPAWRNDAFQGYADHMDSDEFRQALDRLVDDILLGIKLAVMCAETLWWRCHRRLIADALVVRGVRVVHLLDVRETHDHRLHDALRVGEDGYPVYDVGTDRELGL